MTRFVRSHNRRAYRSGLEDSIAQQIEAKGLPVVYEQHTLNYVKPAKKHRYTFDFILPNGIIIETKGYFTSDDRVKHLHIKNQYPGLDIRFVFSRSASKLSKRSRTSYGDWCEKHGFIYADKTIPEEWFEEEDKWSNKDYERASISREST